MGLVIDRTRNRFLVFEVVLNTTNSPCAIAEPRSLRDLWAQARLSQAFVPLASCIFLQNNNCLYSLSCIAELVDVCRSDKPTATAEYLPTVGPLGLSPLTMCNILHPMNEWMNDNELLLLSKCLQRTVSLYITHGRFLDFAMTWALNNYRSLKLGCHRQQVQFCELVHVKFYSWQCFSLIHSRTSGYVC